MGTCCCWLPSARSGQARSFLLESFLLFLLFCLSVCLSCKSARTHVHMYVCVYVRGCIVHMCYCVFRPEVSGTIRYLPQSLTYFTETGSLMSWLDWMDSKCTSILLPLPPRTAITDMWYSSKIFFLHGSSILVWQALCSLSHLFSLLFLPNFPCYPKAPKSTHWSR